MLLLEHIITQKQGRSYLFRKTTFDTPGTGQIIDQQEKSSRWTKNMIILEMLVNSVFYFVYADTPDCWLLSALLSRGARSFFHLNINMHRLCGHRPSKMPTSPPGRTSRGRRSSWRCSNTSTLCDSTASVLTESRWPWCSNTWDTETSTGFLGMYTGLAHDGWSISSQYETHRCYCED